jgi:ribonucleotide monophosphatase NagD (HAD superfamily)
MALDVLAGGSLDTVDGTKEPREGRVAMIGDRISSDIDGGRAAGLATILVLSGTSSRAQADAAELPPDHVIENLAGLLL